LKLTPEEKEENKKYWIKAPENAVFKMEGDKVVEFKASTNGLKIDIDKTYQDINTLFVTRSQPGIVATGTIRVAVIQVEPEVKTADVNNLGITDIIGIGISTFKDSHNNRIRNIANAVKRLNGSLIKPGEEFSANHYAGPYTAANGFLPEAVIKGDEIKNEIGGGMCQIGTTLFRMAMNSGMDITERRNHSLVVSYYADPVNGNPGTDATLYEPILDLKFKNDTGNYLLLQTDIDYKKQQLTFTLWGKPDGRSGSYTHPIVERWIGAGAPQMVETDTLPPGKEKCQSGFRGAVARFSYTRTTPSGEKIERVFESYYRPLPRICLVGKSTEVGPTDGEILPTDPTQTIVEPVVENTTVDPITSG
jgi:vancomycin resistance protein YoaR